MTVLILLLLKFGNVFASLYCLVNYICELGERI